jgi:2-polyprenyl-3-methyl-5-hydroxy-6-metoxy-1,4-benzoquinol methylase
MFRCPTCGLLFNGAADASEVRGLYDDGYFADFDGEAYSSKPRLREYESRRRMALVKRLHRSGRLLEIGAAEGYFLAEARRSGFEVTGVEPVTSVARIARERSGVEVIDCFLEDIALADGSYDIVCAWHVLEHIPAPLGVLEQLHQALRPTGHLFIEVPNAAGRQPQRLGPGWHGWRPGYHVAHYSPRSLRALLERASFDEIAIETFPGTGYFPPRIALRPVELAGYAMEIFRLGAMPRRPHPWRHELLRANARVPRSG